MTINRCGPARSDGALAIIRPMASRSPTASALRDRPGSAAAAPVRPLVAAPVARPARTASRRSAPLVSVLLFLAAIISAFWYLRNEEFERETGIGASATPRSPSSRCGCA